MAPPLRLPVAATVLVIIAHVGAYPTYLTCDRQLAVGSEIMFKPAVANEEVATAFAGKSCGGSYTPGEEIEVSVVGGGTFLIEVSGARLESGTCDSTRSIASPVKLITSSSTGEISAWLGRAESGAGPVNVHQKCTLVPAVTATASPPPAAAPTIAPAGAPAASPVVVKSPPPVIASPPPWASPPPRASPPPEKDPTVTRACFGEGCKYSLLWTAYQTRVLIVMTLEGHQGWVSVGVSRDGTMTSRGAGNLAVIGHFEDGVGKVEAYELKSYTLDQVQRRAEHPGRLERENGKTSLRLELNITDQCATTARAPWHLDVCRGETILIMAYGRSDALGMHQNYYSLRATTSVTAMPNGQGNEAAAERVLIQQDLFWSHIIHICMMLLAWLLLAPIGVGAAMLKHKLQILKEGTPQLWYRLHKRSQVLATALTIVGAGFGSYANASYSIHFSSTHSRVGAATVSIAIIQFLMGWFRPGKKHRLRGKWSITHRTCGYICFVLAMVTISYGLKNVTQRLAGTTSSVKVDTIDHSNVLMPPPPYIPPVASPPPSPPPPPPNFSPPPPPPNKEGLQQAVRLAAPLIHDIVMEQSAGPLFIRLAWHDAGTYDENKDIYGPRGTIRLEPESSNPENAGLGRATNLLESVKLAVPTISYADLYQLAGMVSIAALGGPVIPFRAGRVDAPSEDGAPPGNLVGAHDTADELRAAFYRMGFNDVEIVALSGAHSVGMCHLHTSGFRGPWTEQPMQFGNDYFLKLLYANFSWDGKQFNSKQGVTMMLASDMEMVLDPVFAQWTTAFGGSQELFFQFFAQAYQKLSELGWTGLYDAPYSLRVPVAVTGTVQKAADIIHEMVYRAANAPAFIRLAWHDAGTYIKAEDKWGPRASMRFAPESEYGANNGLRPVRELMDKVKEAVPEISYADMWQLAAYVAIEALGGPKLPFQVGRIDATGPDECPPDGLLPGGHDTAADLRATFGRMGFNDRAIVALSGAHTIGRCHIHNSGFDGQWTRTHLTFSNQYFIDLMQEEWVSDGNVFRNDDRIMLDPDMQLLADPSMKAWTQAFADNKELFFNSFRDSFKKLSELGHDNLQPAPYTLSTFEPKRTSPYRDTVCAMKDHDGCIITLSWDVHADFTATITLTLEEEVRWLALGVSRNGLMVDPPSRAVVADGTSVKKRTLTTKKIGDAAASAVVDSVQDLIEHSFKRVDGRSILTFRTDVEWLRQHRDPTTGEMWFIYAHGPFGDIAQPLGYHGPAGRGRFQVSSFGLAVPQLTTALNASIQTAAGMIHELVRTRGAGPIFIRLAWHDAGTYNKSDGSGGPRGLMRFSSGSSFSANNGLGAARDMLQTIHSAVPDLSYADLWQLAGIVSIEAMGGPKVPFHVGRIDAEEDNIAVWPGRLPGGHDTPEQLRAVFNRMGFDDREIVALLGAHAVGRCHAAQSGFEGPWTATPLEFTNHYFRDMLNKTWVSDGNQNNAGDGTIMLDADLSLIRDPLMKSYVEEFAADSDRFFSAFADVFEKLSTLGWEDLITVPLNIGSGMPRQQATPGTQELKPGLQLFWAVTNGSVSIKMEYDGEVSWMGIGTSAHGRMVDPWSLAVVGDSTGVLRRTLVQKNTLSADHTAPVDATQDLQMASFVRANGKTTLSFIATEDWLEHHAAEDGSLWFIFSHADPDDQSNPAFGYHGPRRGATNVNVRGLPPAPPSVFDGSLQLKQGMKLNWSYNSDGASFWLTLEESVEWLALGLSHNGLMVTSLAVVGSSVGVQQHKLVIKDLTSASATAPLAPQTGIWLESFTNSDGVATLTFRATTSWLTQYLGENNDNLFFVWAHGRPGDVSHTFSYHGINRGSALAMDFFVPLHNGFVGNGGGAGGPPSGSIARAPPAPPGSATGNKAVGGLSLTWHVHNDKAWFTVQLNQEVGWLAIAVSYTGWMFLDPSTGVSQPSLAAVASDAGVKEYKLIGQNPQDISMSAQLVVESELGGGGFSRGGGNTKFVFSAPTSWVFTHLPSAGGAVNFVWAHGPEETSTFGYHGPNRGSFQIQATDLGYTPSPPPAPIALPPPQASCPPCVAPVIDYCGDIVSYRVARCYIREDSLIPTTFDDLWLDYANRVELAPSFRFAWTIEGGFPNGKISVMLQAKTRGWVGFGLMGGSFGHGMKDTDIWYGNVVDGEAKVYDTWSPNIAMPLMDIDYGHTNDITDVGGYEDDESGITTLIFKRKLISEDRWDHQVVQGEMRVIFAWSGNGDDSLSYYHGPSRGFESIILVPHPDFTWGYYVAGGIVIVLLMLLLFYVLDRRRRRTMRMMAEERFNQVRAKINGTVSKDSPQLSFGMAFVPARDFLALGQLVSHEKLRDIGTLRLVDRFDQAKALVEVAGFKILFFSHQWLAFNEPDPSDTHYNCICLALTSLARNKSVDLDNSLVWVDYCSIPQVNKQLQGMAISDLVEYASLATYFIVVVPHAIHADMCEPCNKETYQERGWCRLEQFAKAATGETSNMFTCTSEPGDLEVKFHPYVAESTEWKRSALGVLHGTFSCCQRTKNHTVPDPIHGVMPCDKERLEPALLRIYMAAILRLPHCPLRDQLLSHEELILPSDRFSDDIIRAMHERFDHDLSENMQVPPGERGNHLADGAKDTPLSAKDDPERLLAMIKALQKQLQDREGQGQARYGLVSPRHAELAQAVSSVVPPLPSSRSPYRNGGIVPSYQDPDFMSSPIPLKGDYSYKTVLSASPARAAPKRVAPARDADFEGNMALEEDMAATLLQRKIRERNSGVSQPDRSPSPSASRRPSDRQQSDLLGKVNRKHAERGCSPNGRPASARNGSAGGQRPISVDSHVRARPSLEPPLTSTNDAYGGLSTRDSRESSIRDALQRRSLSHIVTAAMAAHKSGPGDGADSDLEA